MISGKDFIGISNITFCPSYDDLYLSYNIDISDVNLLDVPIIYVHVSENWLKILFNLLYNVNKSVIIISHNSDHNTPNIQIPDCVKKWYSQNVTIKNDKIQSIPIGLENDIWFPEINKKNKIINKLKEPKNIIKLLYINHNIYTNFSERNEPYLLFKQNNWVTLKNYRNGQNFDEYVDDIYNHKFVLCPNGNGVDTHRLWETLYLKSIPIVKHSINVDFYFDLPILFVNDWTEITEDFLNNEYERITNTTWNLEKLYFDYWKNKILNE
jgi:hypothetical protein